MNVAPVIYLPKFSYLHLKVVTVEEREVINNRQIYCTIIYIIAYIVPGVSFDLCDSLSKPYALQNCG